MKRLAGCAALGVPNFWTALYVCISHGNSSFLAYIYPDYVITWKEVSGFACFESYGFYTQSPVYVIAHSHVTLLLRWLILSLEYALSKNN